MNAYKKGGHKGSFLDQNPVASSSRQYVRHRFDAGDAMNSFRATRFSVVRYGSRFVEGLRSVLARQ